MIMMMSAIIVGPFGNYLVPILVGAQRMAFPRLEALSFWLVPCSGIILLSSIGLGGFPTGWTGYEPLADQAKIGMDCYCLAFALIAISLTIVGFNMIATIVTMRAPGLSWGAPADLRVVGVRNQLPDGPGGPGPDRHHDPGAPRPHRRDHLLPHQRGWDRIPLREPLLVLRAPRGLHPGAARLRHRAGDHQRLRPQAAVGLSAGGGRHARRVPAQLLRLAAPPFRQRHQRQSPPLLHADHGADLHSRPGSSSSMPSGPSGEGEYASVCPCSSPLPSSSTSSSAASRGCSSPMRRAM